MVEVVEGEGMGGMEGEGMEGMGIGKEVGVTEEGMEGAMGEEMGMGEEGMGMGMGMEEAAMVE